MCGPNSDASRFGLSRASSVINALKTWSESSNTAYSFVSQQFFSRAKKLTYLVPLHKEILEDETQDLSVDPSLRSFSLHIQKRQQRAQYGRANARDCVPQEWIKSWDQECE